MSEDPTPPAAWARVVVAAVLHGIHPCGDATEDVRTAQCGFDATEVLRALATDRRVREALVAEVHRASVGDWPLDSAEGGASRWWVDQVLAALAPPAPPAALHHGYDPRFRHIR